MPFVHRNMNKCIPAGSNLSRHISSSAGPRALVTLLFSVSFLIGGFAIAQTPEKTYVLVKFVSAECPKKYYFDDMSIIIDGNRVQMDKGFSSQFIQLAPGPHTISGLSSTEYPGAKLRAVRILGYNVPQESAVDASGSVTITLDANLFNDETYDAIEIVTENDCRSTPIQRKEPTRKLT